MSSRRGWAAGTLVLAVSTALWLAVAGAEARAPPSRAQQSAARRLVDAYAPITMLRAAKDPLCHTGKESNGFLPNITIRLLPGPSGAEEYRPRL